MKMYATAKSERATKGQGGNKHLQVTFEAETENGRETVGSVEMRTEGEHIHVVTDIKPYTVHKTGSKKLKTATSQ